MQLGIFAKTFVRPTLAETLDAVCAHGLTSIQFNFASVGLPSMPDRLDVALLRDIRQALAERNLQLAAVSGTFNMIHPDPRIRETGLQRLRVLAAACQELGTTLITLSTGTRDAKDMWHAHPDNNSAAAWSDLLVAMQAVVAIGAEFAVTMAFEPEVSNVVDSALKARRLLDELQSPHVKVVIDGANVFHQGELAQMSVILDQAFAMLGADIALAHAKDLDHDGEAGQVAAGQGLLDWDRYLRLLQQAGYRGPLILHGLDEQQVAGCVAFLRSKLAALGIST